MAKVGSRRTGSAGVNLAAVTGFLRYVSGQEPSVVDYATEQEALAGVNTTKLMTPVRVKDLMDTLNAGAMSIRANESNPPGPSNNASQNDDAGSAIRPGTLWRQLLIAEPATDSQIQWFICSGFDSQNFAMWHKFDDPALNDTVTDLDDRLVVLEGRWYVSLRANETRAPDTQDNGSQVDDSGNPLRVGSLWRHIVGNQTGATETTYNWYELEGFESGNPLSNAVWSQKDSISAAIVNSILSQVDAMQDVVDSFSGQISSLQSEIDAAEAEIDTLQTDLDAAEAEIDTLQTDLDAAETDIDNLQSSLSTANSEIDTLQTDLDAAESNIGTIESTLATLSANVFESSGLIAITSGEVILELLAVPNDNSLSIRSQASDETGLFNLIEDLDYQYLGSWIFLRKDDGEGDRTVDDGDVLDVDYFKNLARPSTPTASNGGAGAVSWDGPFTGYVEIYKCETGDDITIMSNWSRAGSWDVNYSAASGFSAGDRVILRRVLDDTNPATRAQTCGAWSNMYEVT